MENIIQNNGMVIAGSGILVVFTGLVLIALVIHFFNSAFSRRANAIATETGPAPEVIKKPTGKPVPEDHLAAIVVALEIYRKLYYDPLDSKITFVQGEEKSGWKTGTKFGQRTF